MFARTHPLSGDAVKFDRTEVPGRSRGPAVGRVRLLVTEGIPHRPVHRWWMQGMETRYRASFLTRKCPHLRALQYAYA